MSDERKRELLIELIGALAAERGLDVETQAAVPIEELFSLFRALVNTRPANPAAPELLAAQDELLQATIADAGIATLSRAQPSPLDERLFLWRGDIATLEVDAIVNAANSQMLGCWVPGHSCIDNAIHTFSGIQLRLACAQLMEAQGHEEPTGQAKITDAFNLPSRYVIHTVGPIAQGAPSDEHCEQLASCYKGCLDVAAEHDVASIAFCCISTGVFGFPAEAAAEIAVATVRSWLDEHEAQGEKVPQVVFNVFLGSDEEIYQRLLGIDV